MGASQSALPQSCSTSGIDPVAVTCSNPGGIIATTDTTNSVSPNAATNDGTQSFNADLIGNVTATTTVNGTGLNLVTTKANGGITMINNGAVTTNQFINALNALQLNGNGGLITYSGNGSISNTNFGGSGLAIRNNSGGSINANTGTGAIAAPNAVTLSTTGAGAIDLTTGGVITGGISSTAVNGLNTVNVTGGTVTGGFAVEASSTGTGGVTVNTMGGQIHGSLAGIVVSSSGAAGDLHVTAGTIIASLEDGVFASISNAASTGAVRVDVNGTISANQDGVLAGGAGAVTVNVGNDITAGGNGVSAGSSNGLTIVNQTTGIIHSTGDGIDAYNPYSIGTGGVTVNMSGGQIGSNGNAVGGAGISVLSLGTAGDINVTARSIFSRGDGIYARIGNAGSAGNINVTVDAGATVNVNSAAGIFAQTVGSGDIIISVKGNVSTSNGHGIDAEIIRDSFDPLSGTGNISVINNANIVSGGAFAGVNLVGGNANSVTNIASITGNVGLRVSGGTTSLTNLGTITGTGGTAVQIDRGTLQLKNGNGALVGNVVDNGVFAINRTEAWTFAGGISGTGEFQQLGTSTTTLSGTNTYTGPTTVNGGTLSVNGSIASSSLTTVNAGGTLAGNGIVGNTTVNGGTLAPGNSIGLLTVQGSLVFTAASSYMVEVSPANADRVNVTGRATLGGATVNASFAAGTYVAKQYAIINATGGVSGTFGAQVNTNLPSGFHSSLSYDANNAYLRSGVELCSAAERWAQRQSAERRQRHRRILQQQRQHSDRVRRPDPCRSHPSRGRDRCRIAADHLRCDDAVFGPVAGSIHRRTWRCSGTGSGSDTVC